MFPCRGIDLPHADADVHLQTIALGKAKGQVEVVHAKIVPAAAGQALVKVIAVQTEAEPRGRLRHQFEANAPEAVKVIAVIEGEASGPRPKLAGAVLGSRLETHIPGLVGSV